MLSNEYYVYEQGLLTDLHNIDLMKYTSHFSQILKGNGSPCLSQDMFALYMNIVHLEGRIAQLNDLANIA